MNVQTIRELDKMIRCNPNDVKAYTNRGNAYRYEGNYDREIEDCNKAIKINPEDDTAYNIKGWVYRCKKDYDRAIQNYGKAIEFNPKFALAYSNRGNAYTCKGEYDKAIEDLNEAIRLDSEHALAYINRGTAYFHKGDSDRAVEDWDNALRLCPNYETLIDGNFEYGGEVEVEAAIEPLESMIPRNPESATDYYYYGLLYLFWNHKINSRRYFERALELGYSDQDKVKDYIQNLTNP